MRIAWDITATQLDGGGTARAIEQTIELVAADPRVDLVRLEHPGRPGRGRVGAIRRGVTREFWYLPHVLPRRASEVGAELLHCPSQLVPGRTEMPLVITLHDAIGWEHPEWLTRANVHQLQTRVPRAVAQGAHVITSSEYSRDRLIEALAIPAERITCVPLGIDRRFVPASDDASDRSLRSSLGVSDPYIFTAGTLQPRKNLEAAIAAFERLSDQQHSLVIAGARGWRDDELLARIADSPARKRIQLLGRVGDDELIALYRGADCFVFPSRYEGFGFPPLEAMACGSPVLSSTSTSLAEAVGEAAVAIDPDDPAQIAHELDRVLGDRELRARLVADGLRRAAMFTWDRCAARTIGVYERILGRTRAQ